MCENCGNFEERHIGKSSAGWCFGLHVYPDNGINDLQDWIDLWNRTELNEGIPPFIENEYGERITVDEMLRIISERSWRERTVSNEHLKANYAVLGPNNLLRAKIDGFRCIGHGQGTWDLLVGEFS